MPRRAQLFFAACAAASALGCVQIDILGGATRPLVESVVQGKRGPKILLVEIDGMIQEGERRSGPLGTPEESSVARLREQLDRAREDDQIAALLLRINSPGGTATASDVLYREIQRYQEDAGVPVVAYLWGTATSGAYYAAMAADTVIAHPTTVTGSIGVIFVGLNFSGLMEKLGIENQTLVAGASKDAGSPLRPMKPAEREHLESVLADLRTRFVRVVEEGRPGIAPERLELLADGRVYSADQALANGLVDALGDLEDAVGEAERRAGIPTSRVVTYHRPRQWRSNAYSRTDLPARVQIDLTAGLWPPRMGFLYLWAPAGFQ